MHISLEFLIATYFFGVGLYIITLLACGIASRYYSIISSIYDTFFEQYYLSQLILLLVYLNDNYICIYCCICL